MPRRHLVQRQLHGMVKVPCVERPTSERAGLLELGLCPNLTALHAERTDAMLEEVRRIHVGMEHSCRASRREEGIQRPAQRWLVVVQQSMGQHQRTASDQLGERA